MKGRFEQLVDQLEQRYGSPQIPPPDGPLEWVLWDCVGYLCDDSKREEAFNAVKQRVGTEPHEILAASSDVLTDICKLGGILAEMRAERLKEIAALALDCDLAEAVKLPVKQAIKEISRFPGLSTPGAERILLFCGSANLLPLESNGLRVLLRIGYGRESANYSQSYRSVQQTLSAELPSDRAALIRAYFLLRTHGQQTCRRITPACPECPLMGDCAYAHGATE